jgi:heptosyltransferase-2
VLVRALDAVGALAMRPWRRLRPVPAFGPPRRILLVQLDHLGDAVLTSPLLAGLHAAYPAAEIDVLASPSNREVFEADPHVHRVHLAQRSWFERDRGRWALGSAVWDLGRSLRAARYDLGLDVRGDILTVLVLILAGIPRRVGWAMGGGGFLLTDVAGWIPGRHEVSSRLALLERLGVAGDGPPRVEVHVTDRDRTQVARWLREAWDEPRVPAPAPAPAPSHRAPAAMPVPVPVPVGASKGTRPATAGRRKGAAQHGASPHPLDDEADRLHAGRFGEPAPLLAAHLGAGTAAKRWPPGHWKRLLARFLDDGWRVVVIGGPEDADAEAARGLVPHERLRDWTGRMTVPQTTAFLERADLFLGADSGPSHLAACAGTPSVVLFSGTNRPGQWRPWSRRSLILRHDIACRPCHHKVCPLADHPCMSGLDPERVYRAARRWWARLHRAESPHAPL